MDINFFLRVFLPCLLGLMALFFFIVGLRGLVTRKPFLFSARWLFGVMLLAFVPTLLQPFLIPMPHFGDESVMLSLLPWLGPIMIALLVVFLWFTLRGYLAFAVTDESFREGIMASLKKLELPHEEKLAAIHLPSVGADLQVAYWWMGIGQVKVKQRQFNGLLVDIVRGMNEYYQSSTVPMNLICCIIYVLMGVFTTVFAGVLLFTFQNLV